MVECVFLDMQKTKALRKVTVIRYITALREGGSLPALADADDGYKYVLKFRGAGHGVKALISELIGGEIARLLNLRVPELVFADLGEDFGRTEADEEIQDLLKWSEGTNLGLQFLSGAINYDPAVMEVDALTASKIVWMDAFITNIDRTYRNTNMLMHKGKLWLIDHGAALYFHHSWNKWKENAKTTFPLIKDHVLLPQAAMLSEINESFKQQLSIEKIAAIIELIPDNWLEWRELLLSPNEIREIYKDFFKIRLQHTDSFVKEAQDARENLHL